MTYGGYPRIASSDDIEMKKIMLKDLYDTMILKDIARVFSIEDLKSLEDFSRYLAINISGLVSYENISKNLNISFQTIRKYLNAMEKSHLIARVLPFFNNKTKEIVKQPKLYFIDTGLRNIIAKKFDSEPEGKLFENYVFSELLKLGLSPKYWRTKTKLEIDFIIEKESQIIPIEVKINSKEGIGKNIHNFIELYKPKKAIVVSYDGDKSETHIEKCKIVFTDVLGMKEALES